MAHRTHGRAPDVVQRLDGAWRAYVGTRLVATAPAPFRARRGH